MSESTQKVSCYHRKYVVGVCVCVSYVQGFHSCIIDSNISILFLVWPLRILRYDTVPYFACIRWLNGLSSESHIMSSSCSCSMSSRLTPLPSGSPVSLDSSGKKSLLSSVYKSARKIRQVKDRALEFKGAVCHFGGIGSGSRSSVRQRPCVFWNKLGRPLLGLSYFWARKKCKQKSDICIYIYRNELN